MLKQFGLAVPDILLPEEEALPAWAVVACDQFTSQSEYWEEVSKIAAGKPSALHVIYPEAWLDQGDGRIEAINKTMRDYEKNVLTRALHGMILVERTIATGRRLGLVAAIDLERYDFSVGSQSLVRATEGTILERIPPRVKIRQNASLELPHVLLLVDDPKRTLIEPLYAERESLAPVYDFELMMGGGHIRGWLVENAERLEPALERLTTSANGLLFAVGDGNHSLATARQCWLNIRDTLTEAERENHPARFALVEIENLHDDALVFEPIHRALFHVCEKELLDDFSAWLEKQGMTLARCEADRAMFRWVKGERTACYAIENLAHPLPLAVLQSFLDEWLGAHRESSVDYIHGEETVRALSAQEGVCGVLLPAMDKRVLFEAVRVGGALPRKTFSMGEAVEKRYYLECRKIRP